MSVGSHVGRDGGLVPEPRVGEPRERGSRPTEGRAKREPFPRIITVSREFSAGGARISGRVAAELGFQLWDHELLAHLARKAHADVSALREVDERERDLLDEVLSGSFGGKHVSGSSYRALLARAVSELAERGGAVIVGRGANFLVSAEQALRVRVVCPLKQRIDRYARNAQVDWARAERFVRTKDRDRERFVRQLCGDSSCDPTHYDLVLNTAELSDEAAGRLIISAYQARFGGGSAALGRTDSLSSSSIPL